MVLATLLLITVAFNFNVLAALKDQPEKKHAEKGVVKFSDAESLKKNATAITTKTVSGKQEISVGCSLPTSGGDRATAALQISDGMTLFFNKMLKDPSGPSFTCALKALDDTDKTTKLKENIVTLLKDSPIIISPYGTDTLSCLMPYVIEEEALVMFPLEGSSAFRTSEYTNLIFFRASFAAEIKALIGYTIKTLGKKKIALFYEASEWGEGVLKDAEKALSTYNLKLFAASSYPQNSLNITQGAEALVQKAPDAILCIAGSRPAYNFIRHIINKGLHQTIFLGLTALTSIQTTLAKSRGVNIITSSVVPDPENSKTKIAQEYRTDMQKFFPNKPRTPFSFEGYINAALLVEALKLTTFPYTPEKIVTVFTKLKHVKFKDLELKFNPETRSLSDLVWLNIGNGQEWILANKQSEKSKKKKEEKKTNNT